MFQPSALFKTGMHFVNENAPAILTAFGAIGVVGTAVLTGKASYEACNVIGEAQYEHNQEEKSHDFTNMEKAKLVWTLYIPAVTTGTVSIAAIVMSHRISSKRIAVLAAAYAMSEDKRKEYEEKIREKFGIKKEGEARDEMAQARVTQDFADGEPQALFTPMDGLVLIKEEYTRTYFWSTLEKVNQAVNMVNAEMNAETDPKKKFATMDDFYKKLGLENTSMSHAFGWTAEDYLSIEWHTCTTPDGKTAVHSFEYVGGPVMNPSRAAADEASFR